MPYPLLYVFTQQPIWPSSETSFNTWSLLSTTTLESIVFPAASLIAAGCFAQSSFGIIYFRWRQTPFSVECCSPWSYLLRHSLKGGSLTFSRLSGLLAMALCHAWATRLLWLNMMFSVCWCNFWISLSQLLCSLQFPVSSWLKALSCALVFTGSGLLLGSLLHAAPFLFLCLLSLFGLFSDSDLAAVICLSIKAVWLVS